MRSPFHARFAIYAGVALAALSGAAMLLMILVAVAIGEPYGEIGWLRGVEGVLLLALAFGLLQKSRTCALMLCLYFALFKLLEALDSGIHAPLASLAFLAVFAAAAWATFAWPALAPSDDAVYI